MIKQTEADVQAALHKYMQLQYPGVLAFCNYYTAVDRGHISERKRGAMAAAANRQGFLKGQPDYYVEAARGAFHGLRMELKCIDTDPFRIMPQKGCIALENDTIDGERLRLQASVLDDYRRAGYFACFAAGFDQAKAVVDWYMKGGASPGLEMFSAYRFAYGWKPHCVIAVLKWGR